MRKFLLLLGISTLSGTVVGQADPQSPVQISISSPTVVSHSDSECPRDRRALLFREQRTVLELPVKIANQSNSSVKAIMNHEWGGGIPPTTDLQFALDDFPYKHRAYLVGAKPSKNAVTIPAQSSIEQSIRLNWAGTGSVMYSAPIDECEVGKKRIKFFLRLEHDGKVREIVSPEFFINIVRHNQTLQPTGKAGG